MLDFRWLVSKQVYWIYHHQTCVSLHVFFFFRGLPQMEETTTTRSVSFFGPGREATGETKIGVDLSPQMNLIWLWSSKPMGSHFGVGAPPNLVN